MPDIAGPDEIHPWGPGVAKVRAEVAFADGPGAARLVLVSAISPTAAGNGKTTVAIGLTDAARRRGVRAACALRQPSLGPIFGLKGGATGGGRAQLVPADRINLHLTGDIHAVTSAHNLLAALADNAIFYPSAVDLDGRQVVLRRVLDMNDRFLRRTVIGLGGAAMGVPREDGFDITAASEVMAILCLARDYADLKRRLGAILVGFGRSGAPVYARDLGADGAMAALLRDALLPNLVATAEGAPVLVHGGPFGNIAHGASSLIATRLLLRRAEVVFTEAGFGFDLGAEKFLDIKCRAGGIWPHTVVLVATLAALRVHGLANLDKHVENVRRFGLEPIVALNRHAGDAENEIAGVLEHLRAAGVEGGTADVFARGGDGALELVDLVLARAGAAEPRPTYLYALDAPPAAKIEVVARTIYGARSVDYTVTARRQLDQAVALGFGALPVCIAKTHLSLSDDARLVGRPQDFDMTVREVRIAAGAGFLVPMTGEIMTMPGLPRAPHATAIDLLPDGTIAGVS